MRIKEFSTNNFTVSVKLHFMFQNLEKNMSQDLHRFNPEDVENCDKLAESLQQLVSFLLIYIL